MHTDKTPPPPRPLRSPAPAGGPPCTRSPTRCRWPPWAPSSSATRGTRSRHQPGAHRAPDHPPAAAGHPGRRAHRRPEAPDPDTGPGTHRAPDHPLAAAGHPGRRARQRPDPGHRIPAAVRRPPGQCIRSPSAVAAVATMGPEFVGGPGATAAPASWTPWAPSSSTTQGTRSRHRPGDQLRTGPPDTAPDHPPAAAGHHGPRVRRRPEGHLQHRPARRSTGSPTPALAALSVTGESEPQFSMHTDKSFDPAHQREHPGHLQHRAAALQNDAASTSMVQANSVTHTSVGTGGNSVPVFGVCSGGHGWRARL